jgi:hypothetical protein
MEEAVWLAFGVIALILGLAIITTVISTNKEESQVVTFKEALDKMKQQCDFVCDSPLDTKLSVDCELPSGLKLYTSSTRICGNLNISADHSDENKCVMCKCAVTMPQPLDLQTELARKSFTEHKYSCSFERKENEIQMECKG